MAPLLYLVIKSLFGFVASSDAISLHGRVILHKPIMLGDARLANS